MHFLNKNMLQNYIFRIIPTQEISFLHRTAAFWNKKMCLSDKPKRPSDSQARRDSYADCVLCRRIFKNLDRKIFEKCHDIKVDLNFQGGLLYTAAYVRWDFFYRNNIFALCWGSFEDRRHHRGKKAFYSIVSSNIPFSFTAISWGLVFILHTTPTFMLLPTHFFWKKANITFWMQYCEIQAILASPLQVLLGSKATTARSFAWMFPKGHYTLLCYFFSKAQCGVRISRQM